MIPRWYKPWSSERRTTGAREVCGFVAVLLFAPGCFASEGLFDRVAEALSWSAPSGEQRARLSGVLDFEGYRTQLPAPGLLPLQEEHFLNPRLTTYLDAQWGTRSYIFVQARVDRGFDPEIGPLRVRLDEYAFRFTPVVGRRFSVQIGKFATIVGNWIARHESWPNPLITAPLPYENLTGIWDSEAIRFSGALLQWSHVRPGLPASVTAREKGLRVPIIWGPSYAIGAAASGEFGRFRYALEVKNASLSSRPGEWNDLSDAYSHPTVSSRIGFRPNELWSFGVSASTGPYLRADLRSPLPARRGFGDYRQIVSGFDVAFAWHRLQLWSEIYMARFRIPGVGDADTYAYYVEAKYKFTPQFFGAVRWNDQKFGRIPDRGSLVRWGQDTWRVDFAPGYRITPHTQAKVQLSLQPDSLVPSRVISTVASQLTLRF